MGTDLEKILITEPEIKAKLAELARQIEADYAGQEVLLVGVLKGALMVMADLIRALHIDAEMDLMAVSSYGAGTKSCGVVRILKDLGADIAGRHVLVVEDIIDSGLTLSWLLSNLRSRGPRSVEVFTLLRKPDAAKVEVGVKYVGFDIPNEFVVGYGLDFAERYRGFPTSAPWRRTSTVVGRPPALRRPADTGPLRWSPVTVRWSRAGRKTAYGSERKTIARERRCTRPHGRASACAAAARMTAARTARTAPTDRPAVQTWPAQEPAAPPQLRRRGSMDVKRYFRGPVIGSSWPSSRSSPSCSWSPRPADQRWTRRWSWTPFTTTRSSPRRSSAAGSAVDGDPGPQGSIAQARAPTSSRRPS